MHYQDERTSGCRVSDAWTYRGLKVRNMKLGGTYTTVIFQMQNGKVARVIVQP